MINLPPQNLQAEESILASCMINKNDLEQAIDLLVPDDFYNTAHQEIFISVSEMATNGKTVDIISIAEDLKRKGKLESIGGAVFLAKIIDTAPIVPNIEQYAEIIRNLSIKRGVLSGCYDLQKKCFDDKVSSFEVLDSAQQMILSSEQRAIIDRPVKAGSLCYDLIEEYEKANKTQDGITGISSGFKKLDSITGGLQQTDLIIIAGRPGMGKTSFAMDLAKAATDYDKAVLFESLEMSKEQLVTRMASKISGVDSLKFRKGGITESDWQKIVNAMADIDERELYIDSPRDCDFDSIRRKIRRAKRDYDISAVFIDYLQLMTRKGDFSGRNDLKIGSITRDLKHLAGDLQIPVILLSQLNRELEKRSDKRPVLSDLRESGAIEQDADLIMFLYRDEVYNKKEDNPDKGTGELILSKHRHGPTARIKLKWEDKTSTYKNFIDSTRYNYSCGY